MRRCASRWSATPTSRPRSTSPTTSSSRTCLIRATVWIDRAGHYEFLCKLVPGARHLSIGASTDEHAVNPWDVDDPASPPIEKIAYLVALHALLVGDHRAVEDSYGLDVLERNLLEVA